MWAPRRSVPPPVPGRSPRSTAVAFAAAAGLVLFAVLSIQVYRSKIDPEGFGDADGLPAWIVGPPSKALNNAALDLLEAGSAALNDRSLPDGERVRAQRDALLRAERLFVRSLRAQPSQARALAALAAVRWELYRPSSAEELRALEQMVASASRMAPTHAEVQKDLGRLLLAMGRRDEAADYLARAIELDPDCSEEVVETLRSYLFTADEITAALPLRAEVVYRLAEPYSEEGRQGEYLALLDRLLEVSILPRLLERYGTTCLELGRTEQLLRKMDALGERDDPAVEAARLVQRSRAHQAGGRPDLAAGDARRASDLRPDDAWKAERQGDLELAAGDPEQAIGTYRRALGISARNPGTSFVRSRIYRKIGHAEERRGHPDRAYDAYRRSLELQPEEAHALARVAAMERAAGLD